MRKLIKNNVLPYTFASITILLLATYGVDTKSISGLWHTEYWLLYTAFTLSNALLFIFGDNQITNKLAGLTLICMLIYPVSSAQPLAMEDWALGDWMHHIFAVAFFIIKPLNHRRYDTIFTIIGATALFSIGLTLYQIEIIGLYSLVWQGYLTKKNYFRDKRTQLRNK